MATGPAGPGTLASALFDDALPTLTEYIRIPARSPAFDTAWEAHGHLDRAVALIQDWCLREGPAGLGVEVIRLPGRTPLLFLELAGTGSGNTLLYGHLDKQPEMTGWEPGLGPWEPVLRGGKLYGRGGADDGYAVFAAVAALRALAQTHTPHPRCVVLIECSEESGSGDLPAYLDALAARIGVPELVIALDSGCGDYRRLWLTSGLRGLLNFTLTVTVLRQGVHSGDAGGIVPDSFRIARQLLDRLEDAATGLIRLPELHAAIPEHALVQAAAAAAVLGTAAWQRFPWADGALPPADAVTQLLLARAWRPALAIVGADGLPPTGLAGNVLRPQTTLKLSLRLPPALDAEAAASVVTAALLQQPPLGASVRVHFEQRSTGWAAPATAPWLAQACAQASQRHFGQPCAWLGEGATIPFMALLGARFPHTQFVVTGVLGPGANAHGPNEFLHLATARHLCACIADILAAQAAAAAGRRAP